MFSRCLRRERLPLDSLSPADCYLRACNFMDSSERTQAYHRMRCINMPADSEAQQRTRATCHMRRGTELHSRPFLIRRRTTPSCGEPSQHGCVPLHIGARCSSRIQRTAPPADPPPASLPRFAPTRRRPSPPPADTANCATRSASVSLYSLRPPRPPPPPPPPQASLT